MADEQRPFEDVRETGDGFSIPELKWRELLFVGALQPDGEAFVRDPSRPLLLSGWPGSSPRVRASRPPPSGAASSSGSFA
jgi:hypothetical protein